MYPLALGAQSACTNYGIAQFKLYVLTVIFVSILARWRTKWCKCDWQL